MKKKVLKIAALSIAILLLIAICVFINAFAGNPISKMLAKHTADAYLTENYTGKDFTIDRVGYNFKDGVYYAHIKSPTSVDSHFTLSISMSGKLLYDDYENRIPNGNNTARRLEEEYRNLTNTVLESPSFPFDADIAYGKLEFAQRDTANSAETPSYILFENDLILDYDYDISKLGKKAGCLVIYVQDDTVNVENAAAIMLEIKRQMDDSAIPFYIMDFVLQYPKPEEGTWKKEQIDVLQFPYDSIYEDGMTARVKAADDAAKAYYAEQDARKEKEIDEKIGS